MLSPCTPCKGTKYIDHIETNKTNYDHHFLGSIGSILFKSLNIILCSLTRTVVLTIIYSFLQYLFT